MAGILAAMLHGVTNRLESSSLLARYIPARFLQVYAQVKRGEYADLLEQVFSREYDYYA